MRLAELASRPPSRRTWFALVATALVVLVVAFREATRPARSVGGSDVTTYERYGSKMLDGELPYRDFWMEYPPAAAPMFVLPATSVVARGSTEGASWSPPNAPAQRYYRGFLLLVLLLLGAIVVLTACTLAATQRPVGSAALALAVVALSPLMIGQVLPERFDIWPAALTAGALAAAVRGRHRLGGALIGLGTAAKLYPAVLLPVLAIVALRQRSLREAGLVVGAAVGATAAVFLPFAVASLSGLWTSLRVQFRGGLQIESLSSSALVLISNAADGSALTARAAGGGLVRFELSGPGVGAAKVVTSVLLIAVLCWLLVSLYRSRSDPREDLTRYAAATVASLLALGTVLSPQYIAWLIPLVPLVGGRRGVAAMLLFVAAAALTNVWIPEWYFDYQADLETGPAALLLARNLALLATAVVLAAPGIALPRR